VINDGAVVDMARCQDKTQQFDDDVYTCRTQSNNKTKNPQFLSVKFNS